MFNLDHFRYKFSNVLQIFLRDILIKFFLNMNTIIVNTAVHVYVCGETIAYSLVKLYSNIHPPTTTEILQKLPDVSKNHPECT